MFSTKHAKNKYTKEKTTSFVLQMFIILFVDLPQIIMVRNKQG